jgi:hypothetical protein
MKAVCGGGFRGWQARLDIWCNNVLPELPIRRVLWFLSLFARDIRG